MKNRVLATAGILTLLLLAEGAWVWAFRPDPADASRNSAGTMSNINGPYITGQPISSSAVNARLADIETEMTDSLDRSGKGGMLAATRGIDGTVSAPAFSWTSETGSGWYRIGASDLGLAISGTKKLELTSTLFTVTPNATFSGTLGVTGTLSSTGVAGFNAVVSALSAGATSRAPTDASLAHMQQIVADHAFAVESTHVNGNYIPGLVWFTSDDNATKPKAGIWMQDTVSGSVLQLGVSNAYATGITTQATLDQTGQLTLPGGVKVGSSGTAISASIRGASSFTPGAVTGQTCAAIAAVTTTGAVANSECSQSITAITAGLAYFCKVTADTCTVYACNVTAGSVTPASNNYGCRVFNN